MPLDPQDDFDPLQNGLYDVSQITKGGRCFVLVESTIASEGPEVLTFPLRNIGHKF